MPIVVALLVALSGGCVMGARVTGGVLAGDGGTTGFVGGIVQIGMVERSLARATLEYGGVASEHPDATRVGLRYTAGARGRLAWTASAAVEDAPDTSFGVVSAGVALEHASLLRETPDVLSGTITGVALEAIGAVGGPDASSLGARAGAQLGVDLGWFTLMR